MRRTIAVLSIGLASVAAARDSDDPHDPVVRPRDRVELEVEYPPDGAVVNGSACGVFVAGRALSVSGESARLDVVIVLDTSLSTIDASGADVDGDGIVGRPLVGRVGPFFDERSSDPGDSVLAAEVAAARLLLHGLDPRRTRLAVVTFSGEASDVRAGGTAGDRPEPASTVQPLTFDHVLIDRALSGVLGQEPSGSTHMAAGVDQATRELVAPAGTSPNLGSEKVVVFFTDGQPTLPYGPAFERENVLAVLDAADRAAQADVRIHSFAIGPDALEGPVAVVEMAARTGGSFTPVPRPGALVELMRDVHFTSLSDVALRSVTTGVEAQPFRLAADGSWIGFLTLEPGRNRVEAMARTDSGAAALRSLDVRLDPDLPEPALPPMFVVQRNELLEICLAVERRVRMSLEKKHLDLVGKELRLEIERARLPARERAAVQRKELKLGIDEEGPQAPLVFEADLEKLVALDYEHRKKRGRRHAGIEVDFQAAQRVSAGFGASRNLDAVAPGGHLQEANPRPVGGEAKRPGLGSGRGVAEGDITQTREVDVPHQLDEGAGARHGGEAAAGPHSHLDHCDRPLQGIGADREGMDANVGAGRSVRRVEHREHVLPLGRRPVGQSRLPVGEEDHDLLTAGIGRSAGRCHQLAGCLVHPGRHVGAAGRFLTQDLGEPAVDPGMV